MLFTWEFGFADTESVTKTENPKTFRNEIQNSEILHSNFTLMEAELISNQTNKFALSNKIPASLQQKLHALHRHNFWSITDQKLTCLWTEIKVNFRWGLFVDTAPYHIIMETQREKKTICQWARDNHIDLGRERARPSAERGGCDYQLSSRCISLSLPQRSFTLWACSVWRRGHVLFNSAPSGRGATSRGGWRRNVVTSESRGRYIGNFFLFMEVHLTSFLH